MISNNQIAVTVAGRGDLNPPNAPRSSLCRCFRDTAPQRVTAEALRGWTEPVGQTRPAVAVRDRSPCDRGPHWGNRNWLDERLCDEIQLLRGDGCKVAI